MTELKAVHKQGMDELKSFTDTLEASGKDAIDKIADSVSGLKVRMTHVNEIGNGINLCHSWTKGRTQKHATYRCLITSQLWPPQE